MTNKKIRERLIAEGRGTLEYFEKEYGEVEFSGTRDYGYYMYPKGKFGNYDNLLSTIPAYDINGLLLFMQGVSQSERVRRCFNEKDS